jgi:nicotinamidase-related amidase
VSAFPWAQDLSAEERAIIERSGYGQPRGLGERPALLVVDMQRNYVGDRVPILESIERYPASGGERAWVVVAGIQRLLGAARERGIPVIHTRVVQKHGAGFSGFARKARRDPAAFLEGAPGTRIIDELAPRAGELVVDKPHGSAFFGTPLTSLLVGLGVDTLLVTGGVTGGCVKATIVDAVALNFNVGAVWECLYDRIGLSHRAALLDLWMKYCDLLSLDEALGYIRTRDRLHTR